MPIPKITGAQRDFSAGELDVAMKRADENPIMKIGARQLSNFRILNSGAAVNRGGRTALFLETGRVDEVLMSPGNVFYLAFGNGYLRVYNAAGTRVFNTTKLGDAVTTVPWTSATVKNITFAIAPPPQFNIYIAYADGAPANPPQILSWDGISQSSIWSLNTYQETITTGGQKRTPFYRLSPQNITLQPSATTGTVNITFSPPGILTAGMIGTRLRFANRQLTIKTVTSLTTGTATVNEPLPPAQSITLSGTLTGSLNVGDLVTGSVSGALGIITSNGGQQTLTFFAGSGYENVGKVGDTFTGLTSGATGICIGNSYFIGGDGNFYTTYRITLLTATAFTAHEHVTASLGNFPVDNVSTVNTNIVLVQLLQNSVGTIKLFTTSDLVVGPQGSSANNSVTTVAPQPISIWDNEIMNLFNGYPSSVFFDQSRLGLTNFPALPSGISWSAIGLPTDAYAGALPSEGIFELAPGKSQVLFVLPGMESSEFVFCDNAIYHIPISPTVPLVPGLVAFQTLDTQGCASVQPRAAQQSILYVKAGGLMIAAIQTPGAYYRPHIVDNVSEFHSHLFTASPPIAIAASVSQNQAEETYAYILLANGTLVVGKYHIRQGLLDVGPDGKPKIGWLPWSGVGASTWVSTQGNDVVLTTSYAPGGVPAVSVVERVDNNQYLDSALSVNGLPAPFTPPGGKGPLFVFPGPNSTVTLIDQGTRFMDTYQVDANGFIVPQNIGGENLSAATLVAGQPWTATLEPFVPDAQPGQDIHQRMFPRRVSRIAIYVSQATGFLIARFFNERITPTSPPLGTVMNTHRVTTWNQDDDPTKPPPLREFVERWRPLGRSFDPRVGVIKDTPGPLIVHEIDMEATV